MKLPVRNYLHSIMLVFFISILSMHSDAGQQAEYVSSSGHDCSSEALGDAGATKSIRLKCDAYHQTTGHTCGPAAVMTLMRYYNLLKPEEMNQKTELRIALEMGSTEDGTSRSQVSNWLENHKFQVESGVKVEAKLIIDNLKKGIPTIIGVNKHWILAKGFNKGDTEEHDEILFADSCCGIRIISSANIDSMWLEAQLAENHCPENIGEYIVAKPK